MPRVEIELHVGDVPSSGIVDGMPVIWKTPGQLLTPAELAAWWSSGTPPAKFLLLTDADQEKVKRAAMRIKYLTDPATTIAAATVKRFGPEPLPAAHMQIRRDYRVSKENVVMMMEEAEEDKAAFVAEGYDTNWGFVQLRKFCVIVADVTAEEARDLLAAPNDPAAHVFEKRKVLRRTRYRCPWWTLFDAPTVAAIRDPNVRVDVDRVSTPFTFAQIAELYT